MAAEAADEPGILDRRYEFFSQNENRRRTWFTVRKELGFSIDEWDALPWWQQRVYIEQLELYAAIQRGEHVPDEESDSEGGAVTDDSLASLGFSVGSG